MRHGALHARLTSNIDVVVENMIFIANSNTKLTFACSPGNLTAKFVPLRSIEALVDFSTASALQLINKYPNIVIIQILFKAFRLGSIKLGFEMCIVIIVKLLSIVAL